MSTSLSTYDRRVQRVVIAFEECGHLVTWLSRAESIATQALPTEIVTNFKSGIAFYLEYNLRLWLKGRKVNYDVVYAVDMDTLLAGKCLAKGGNMVYDAHEYFTEVPELLRKPLKKAIWKALGKWALRHSKCNITVNRSLQDILSREYGVPFEVIRNVPPLEAIPLPEGSIVSKPKDKKILLYQGAVNVGRGIELACDAMAHLNKDTYELWIVGDGDILNQLRKTYGSRSSIKFYGWVEPSHLASITQQAWLGLNMLLPESQNYYYSLTNKYFDYVHANIPAIHMGFPEYTELQKSFAVAYLAKAYTVEELLRGVMYYENTENYSNSKAATYKAKAELNWDAESLRLKALLERWFEKK
jgi:glycosyltransferase involved in cell wall biosynthesis